MIQHEISESFDISYKKTGAFKVNEWRINGVDINILFEEIHFTTKAGDIFLLGFEQLS